MKLSALSGLSRSEAISEYVEPNGHLCKKWLSQLIHRSQDWFIPTTSLHWYLDCIAIPWRFAHRFRTCSSVNPWSDWQRCFHFGRYFLRKVGHGFSGTGCRITAVKQESNATFPPFSVNLAVVWTKLQRSTFLPTPLSIMVALARVRKSLLVSSHLFFSFDYYRYPDLLRSYLHRL
jgi:hypothetical protein